MIERCLLELTDDMIVMRRTVKLMNAVARNQTPPAKPLKWQWPDEFTWWPARKAESTLDLVVAGKKILTVTVGHHRFKSRFGKAGKEKEAGNATE
jgi:hypothetical protein